ncbi:MAG: hypothetical protein WCD16_06840 [Paracoccaceae bacterium]|jgi:hypothetical protein
MKNLILTSALIIGASAPAFAQSQLEMQLGVAPGVYSTAQLAQLKGVAGETGNDAMVRLDVNKSVTVSSSNAVPPTAVKIFADLQRAGDDTNARLFADNMKGTTFSGQSGNARAQAVLNQFTEQSDS